MEKEYPLKHGLKRDSLDRVPNDKATRAEQIRAALFNIQSDEGIEGTISEFTLVETPDRVPDKVRVQFD